MITTKTKIILAVALIALAVGGIIAYGLRSGIRKFGNTGEFVKVNVELYADESLTEIVTSHDWGIVEIGFSSNFSCYVVTTSNVPTILSMATANWNPSNISDYLTLTWNLENETLNINEVKLATFTLAVSPDAIPVDNFSFDAIVTATSKQ